jgi:hypothetical protein
LNTALCVPSLITKVEVPSSSARIFVNFPVTLNMLARAKQIPVRSDLGHNMRSGAQTQRNRPESDQTWLVAGDNPASFERLKHAEK